MSQPVHIYPHNQALNSMVVEEELTHVHAHFSLLRGRLVAAFEALAAKPSLMDACGDRELIDLMKDLSLGLQEAAVALGPVLHALRSRDGESFEWRIDKMVPFVEEFIRHLMTIDRDRRQTHIHTLSAMDVARLALCTTKRYPQCCRTYCLRKP